MTGNLTMSSDKRVYFRDSSISIWSAFAGGLFFTSTGRIGMITPFLALGTAAAGVDPYLEFSGETNTGRIYWMEDEDRFLFQDIVHVNGDVAIPTGSASISYPAYYYGHPSGTSGWLDDTWRTTRVGEDLEVQRMVTGTWSTRQIMSHEGFVRVPEIWHVYGGFQDADEPLSVTGSVWQHVTNATNDLWTGLEADGLALSADVMTILNHGDYAGSLSMTLSALQGKDYKIRLYNITQATQMGYVIGATTTGAGNYTNITLPLYIESNAGDQFRMEIQCTTDSTDPTLRSAVFYLAYLHD